FGHGGGVPDAASCRYATAPEPTGRGVPAPRVLRRAARTHRARAWGVDGARLLGRVGSRARQRSSAARRDTRGPGGGEPVVTRSGRATRTAQHHRRAHGRAQPTVLVAAARGGVTQGGAR